MSSADKVLRRSWSHCSVCGAPGLGIIVADTYPDVLCVKHSQLLQDFASSSPEYYISRRSFNALLAALNRGAPRVETDALSDEKEQADLAFTLVYKQWRDSVPA